MFSVMPVVNCKSKEIPPADKGEDKGVYICPVYKTVDRGNSFVFFG